MPRTSWHQSASAELCRSPSAWRALSCTFWTASDPPRRSIGTCCTSSGWCHRISFLLNLGMTRSVGNKIGSDPDSKIVLLLYWFTSFKLYKFLLNEDQVRFSTTCSTTNLSNLHSSRENAWFSALKKSTININIFSEWQLGSTYVKFW